MDLHVCYLHVCDLLCFLIFLFFRDQIHCVHESDFDENGIFYWIGTNAKTSEPWLNPAKNNLVLVRCSDGRRVSQRRIISLDRLILSVHRHSCSLSPT